MYKYKRDDVSEDFSWSCLGEVSLGRANLGDSMPVEVYRLFQFTLRNVLTREYGVEASCDVIRKSGQMAGREFARKFVDMTAGFDEFIASVQRTLKQKKIGIFRVEKADLDKMEFYITVEEDLECSGLPITNESVCEYDEGFIAGLLNEYTGKSFIVREIDCWATGARVCRFKANLQE